MTHTTTEESGHTHQYINTDSTKMKLIPNQQVARQGYYQINKTILQLPLNTKKKKIAISNSVNYYQLCYHTCLPSQCLLPNLQMLIAFPLEMIIKEGTQLSLAGANFSPCDSLVKYYN